MFKIVFDIKEIEYDAFLDEMMTVMSKQKAAGMKIPPMMNATMLKKMPKNMKDSMIIGVINKEKQQAIQMVEAAVAKQGGKIQVNDVILQAVEEPRCKIRFTLDIKSMDYDMAIDKIIPMLLTETDLPEVLKEQYTTDITMDNIVAFMKQQPNETKEYLLLKSMSVKKAVIKIMLESMAATKNIRVTIANIRFMLRK